MANKEIKIHDENDKTVFECKLNLEEVEKVSAGSVISKIFLALIVLAAAIGIGYLLATR